MTTVPELALLFILLQLILSLLKNALAAGIREEFELQIFHHFRTHLGFNTEFIKQIKIEKMLIDGARNEINTQTRKFLTARAVSLMG